MIRRSLLCPILTLRAKESNPNVSDHSRPSLVQQHVRLAGPDAEIIPVALLIKVPTRISFVEVARMERPSCGLARSSKTPASMQETGVIPRVISKASSRFIIY